MASKRRKDALQAVLTRETLQTFAGDRYFARGEDYERRSLVHDLYQEEEGLTAWVRGTEDYYVELWVEEGDLQSSCNCPLGVDDIFCKHCVAVGLTWLNHPEQVKVRSSGQSAQQPVQKPVTMQEVQHYLEQQDRSTLMKWIIDRIQQDPDWKRQVFLKVAAHRSGGVDMVTFRRSLRDAIVVRGYLEWNEVYYYAERIGVVYDSIQALLPQYPQNVIDLCEAAISLLGPAMNSIDDSSGDVGSCLEEFQNLHYQACELAPPDPVTLANRLFNIEIESEFGSFANAADIYADLLGKTGLACYQTLAEAKWQELVPQTSGRSAQRSGEWNYQRSKVQRILETLARRRNDLEAIVAIKQQDLSNAYAYLEIAQLYQADGQADRALAWAESGVKAFGQTHPRLRDFLIEEYHQRDRIAEAMELVWSSFTHVPTLQSYQYLKQQADRIKQWQHWREQAIAWIRQQLEPAPQPAPTRQTRRSAKGRSIAPSMLPSMAS
ncbi:MAG: hypothetical protein VKJ24_09420, partial [Synechococcales bacterium]|nr:hypothetical protein [Synechococcales bacterium]